MRAALNEFIKRRKYSLRRYQIHGGRISQEFCLHRGRLQIYKVPLQMQKQRLQALVIALFPNTGRHEGEVLLPANHK